MQSDHTPVGCFLYSGLDVFIGLIQEHEEGMLFEVADSLRVVNNTASGGQNFALEVYFTESPGFELQEGSLSFFINDLLDGGAIFFLDIYIQVKEGEACNSG